MLLKIITKNKYGNPRTRIISKSPAKPFSHGKGFGDFFAVSSFKYQYKHPTSPPALFKSPSGDIYIVPTWEKVLPETTLEDINWVRDKVIEEKTISKPKEWKFESKSKPGSFYIVKQISDYKVTCNCSGQYRARDRKCIHLKTVMKELGI